MSVAVWIGFIVFVCCMLAVDLGVFHRKSEAISMVPALRWTAVCITVTLLFTLLVYGMYEHSLWGWIEHTGTLSGRDAATQFFTAWLLEQSLSLDNIFVIAMIFRYFEVPTMYQHRVLLWGILGAIVMRGIFIALGATLIHTFHWTMYLFGIMLLYGAYKTFRAGEDHLDLEKNPLLRIARKFFPVTDSYRAEHFVVREQGLLMITPLLLVLLVIESCDLVFAIDSIPAVFGVTSDPFIVFTSNIFAILCLRSLYFILSNLLDTMRYLKVSLAFVLGFIGVKMMLHHHYLISSEVSLVVVAAALVLGGAASYIIPVQQTDVGQD